MSYYSSRLTNHDPSPTSSGAATPTTVGSASAYGLSSSINNMFSGLMRRFSGDVVSSPLSSSAPASHGSQGRSGSGLNPNNYSGRGDGVDGVYQASTLQRTASPFRPPPLDALVLKGYRPNTPASARLLSTAVAEEIRTLVPARLQIADEWRLIYSLEQDGASLATLYQRCAEFRGQRVGFVLVVRDLEGGTFGGYLSEYPHPNPKYFGSGECFLWRASVLTSLPPPPSADTTNLTGRTTTIASPQMVFAPAFPALPQRTYSPRPNADEDRVEPPVSSSISSLAPAPPRLLLLHHSNASSSSVGTNPTPTVGTLTTQHSVATSTSSLSPSASLPDSEQGDDLIMVPSIRFTAFPYSGENDYYMLCESSFLSLGAGDGHYGLWLNDGLDRGVSMRCDTFGNEPLSDEGHKFGVLGVEVWVVGAPHTDSTW